MVDMLKAWVRWHGHHLRILRWRTEVFRGRCGIFFVLVLIIAFAVEVFRTFMFMGRADL